MRITMVKDRMIIIKNITNKINDMIWVLDHVIFLLYQIHACMQIMKSKSATERYSLVLLLLFTLPLLKLTLNALL